MNSTGQEDNRLQSRASQEEVGKPETGRVLVVDDNRLSRMKLSLSVQQQGHSVSMAENGLHALEELKAGGFDVVLLDIIMPEMDGYQVLEKIKSDPELRDIPVIIISALDEIESAVRCIEMGAEDYLPKAFDPILLRARLNASLQKKKLRDLEKKYLQQEAMLHQNEKLATLGRLSAGMAHELNNPAAAAQRGAVQLQASLKRLQEVVLRLSGLDLSQAQMDMLLELTQQAQERAKNTIALDIISRGSLEAELEDWLNEKGVENAWEAAPNLAGLGYKKDDLALKLSSFAGRQLEAAIQWLHCTFTIYSLLEEIRLGTGHISEIVKALKTYTYLDQAPIQNVDVHAGLEDTLVILRSKLTGPRDGGAAPGGIIIRRDYDPELPKIEAYGSELNQVWTNLIDNAIDAMDGVGEIVLRTDHDEGWVRVEIEDNGPGIPEKTLANIYDPFFTTKAPGQGSGLGLNISRNIIVQKHHGKILVSSQPGKTSFKVSLPRHLADPGER